MPVIPAVMKEFMPPAVQVTTAPIELADFKLVLDEKVNVKAQAEK